MKKKTDYQVSHRTLYRRMKLAEKVLASVRALYGEACTDNDRLKAENRDLVALNHDHLDVISALQREEGILRNRLLDRERGPRRTVDPTAEVVMGMKRAMEFSIDTSASLLDAMGELVDTVSGRKARRERDQERERTLDPSIVDLER